MMEPAPRDPRSTTDFRDHAANERTMLAWLRTGLALMAFGFAIARFALFLRQMTQARAPETELAHGLGSTWFGAALVVLGLVVNAAATIRYEANRRALVARRDVSPSPVLVYVVGIASVVIGAAMAAVLGATSP
jgi:putative membrane protein